MLPLGLYAAKVGNEPKIPASAERQDGCFGRGRIIAELTDKLHTAKGKRQIIFASHNANIVVNGSSELVGHLEVTDTGTRQFECVGAIDDPEIRKVIAGTMEGGERAFKDRQNKYGY